MLRQIMAASRVLLNRISDINYYILVLFLLKLLCTIIYMDYCYVYYGYDLLYWLDGMSQNPIAYIFSYIVLTVGVHVVMSCVEVTILSRLIRRNRSRYNKPRQYFEERYRRFVLMRLVHQLEKALQMQKRFSEQSNQPHDMAILENLHLSHQQIHQAVNDFRTSVAILLWPNRADLQMDPFILYHIDEGQLSDLKRHGYSLRRPEMKDIRTENLRSLLNPPGY
ncbi:uncharacterized protein LOC116804308 [Drosophila mojavensis]|uniref:Uncharacterized protein LOC108613202 n=1 Tax=Drosophila arizonae TaxID=7263 RepID=A0ABM1P455_DROAR|nr:PREDICTED: uncharacterized protein LOC108613202 [Drosophila arizonae]XP_032586902.1 uncharacterized protein LOC116804308 [Drosophila mojavensis]